MASRKSPLRDRLLSNSPDPIKSSILRESGMGWNTPTTNGSVQPSGSAGSITSPLRIAKRDSPSGRVRGPTVARRTSSSYRHVHTNNLVSKSPFKSQIPTPSTPSSRPPISFPTRRVSGEKRPRPSSMHELGETENDRPFALKRDRKQSKTFQGLIDKEPVTKSPFRVQHKTPVAQPPKPPLVPIQNEQPTLSSTPPAPSHIPAPVTASSNGPSPGRSSLVSRRMHGPRLSGGSRRERRKTVTFHERCDVLEFDREDTEEEVFESTDEESRDDPPHDLQNEDESMTDSSRPNNDRDDVMEDDPSYESIQLSDGGFNPPVPSLLSDPDASITGIVEEMFLSSNAANFLADISMTSGTSTPPRHADIPTDLETEDGVPFGRSHHVERFMHNQHSSPSQQPPHFSPHSSPAHQTSSHNQSPSYLHNFNLPTHASPLGPPATPPRRSPAVRHSTPPLGRSTHIERIRKVREEERGDEADGDDIAKLPLSPSPMKRPSMGNLSHDDSLIPKFDLNAGVAAEMEANRSTNLSLDPFESRIQDVSILPGLEEKDISVLHEREHPVSPGSISIGNSEVNLSALVSERDCEENLKQVLQSLDTSLQSEGRSRREGSAVHASPPPSEYFPPMSHHMTPPVHSGSPLLTAVQSTHTLGKIASRERISREEVQRRLMIQRSPGSPMPDKVAHPSTQSPRPTIFVDPAEDLPTPSKRSMPTSLEALDPETNRLSVITTQTDFSIETAIVDTAEKRNLGMTMLSASNTVGDNEFGLLGPGQRLQFDFGSKFSVGGLGISSEDTDTRDNQRMRQNVGVPAEKAPSTMSIQSSSSSGMKMGDVDVDMDMKSALDRLMEDVAGAGARADDSIMSDEYDESCDQSRSHEDHDHADFSSIRPKIMERAATDSVLLQQNEADGILSRAASGSSTLTGPPPVPPKDNIRQREQIILEKRREARRMEEEGSGFTPARGKDQEHLGVGRPSRRRSMSTGDAEVLSGGAKKRGNALLDIADPGTGDDLLTDSIEKELQKLVEPAKKSKYHVREREGTIYASSSDEKVSHMAGPGDVDTGRAWRTVRRPSDMNEYAKQIKEYRAQEKGKAYGKVFVKVLGIKGMHLPLPREATAFTCTLNNGIHFVTTPECQLLSDCRIKQEFELIEHSKLEFTLTLKIRRDPHIIAQFKAISPSAPVPAPPPVVRAPVVVQTASKSSGMRSFFSSSPKKSSKDKIVAQAPLPVQSQPQQPQRLAENLARHLKPDGTLARAFISFKDIAARCDTRLFETSYPLIGQRVELGGKFSTLEIGEIVLQLFRLPPLPGIPQDQLPQSLEECHRGLRHINWHKVTYFQGTLTQLGGDCSTWRRRQLRVIGANLVAFNDVTKKATATIDLKKAIAVEDDQEARNNAQSPGGTSRYADEYDGLYGVERSFRLIFPQSQEIIFFADSDEEKSKWLEVLRALVGRIPPHPLWAELLWQRQEEISKRMAAAQQTVSQTSPIDSRRPQY